jgi:hypothetical protein
MPDFHQLPCTDQMTQHTADLVIATKVAEIVTQKHIAPLAGQALQNTVFEVFWLHSLPNPRLSQYDIISKISTGESIAFGPTVSSEASFPISSFSAPCQSFSGDSLQMHGALCMVSEWKRRFGSKA